jgi:hypothetical protein
VNYGLNDFTKWELKFGYARTRDEAFSNWMRIFLLNGDGPRPWTVISASNNFQDLSHDLPAPLAGRISELYDQNFDAIFPRDGYSLRNLLACYPGAAKGQVWGGIDAAFLCRPQDLPLAQLRWRSRRSFTFFFGRSRLRNTEELIRRIARETGLRPVHLKRWLSLTPKFVHWQYLRSLKHIHNSQFVLSDAYHCCINAINRERPAFGVGRWERAQTGTLSDFKKQELFRMHGLDDLYTAVTSPELSEDNMCSIVEKACALMDDFGFAERRYAKLRTQRAEYEALLLMALRS